MQRPLHVVDSSGPRFIDPKAPLEKQIAVLLDLIKNSPENSRVITITPELSQWVLDNRLGRQRKRKPARIKRYAIMMEEGPDGWVLSGDTVKFGRGGKCIDGQNRLAACFAAQKSFRTHVVFGIDDDAFDVIDSGKVRTPNDTLYTAGVAHSEIVTPAVRWINILKSDTPTDRGRSFSNQETLEYWKSQIDSERMERAVQWAMAAHKIIPRGSLAACLYLFDEKNPAAAKKFAADLAKVQRAGRKLVDKFGRLHRERVGRIHENLRNALIILAWNAFRANGPVAAKHLSWADGKQFPSISD